MLVQICDPTHILSIWDRNLLSPKAHPTRPSANAVPTSAPPFNTARRLIVPIFLSTLVLIMFKILPRRVSSMANSQQGSLGIS